MKKNVFLALILIIVCISDVSSIFAQDFSSGVATYLPIIKGEPKDGAIISSTNGTFELTTEPYDSHVIGVISLNPAVTVGSPSGTLTYPVMTSGRGNVLVSTENGPIKKGDLITSSSKAGVGMKLGKAGFIVGTALADFNSSNKNEVKKIPLVVNVQFYTTKSTVQTHFLDIFNLSALAANDEPLTVFKYVVSLTIVIASFLIGFFSFGRMAAKGVEALGRNPLASRMIQIGIIFNLLLTVVIVGAGILVAVLILRL